MENNLDSKESECPEPLKPSMYFWETYVKDYESVLEEVRAGIDNHEYSCVIGDDKTSRIPTRVIGRVINSVYKERNEKRIPLLYIDPNHAVKPIRRSGELELNGKDQAKYKELVEKAASFVKSHGVHDGKILLITDYVQTRATTEFFKNVAKSLSIEIDVVSRRDWFFYKQEEENRLRDNPDTSSIFALPLFGKVETLEQAAEQLRILIRNFVSKTRPYITNTEWWYGLLKQAGISEENYPSIRSFGYALRRNDEKQKELESKISFEQKKRLVALLKEILFKDENYRGLVESLSERYLEKKKENN